MIHPDSIKTVGDAASIGTIVATLVGWLPSVAAALTIVWTLFRIYNEVLDSRIKKKVLKDEQGRQGD